MSSAHGAGTAASDGGDTGSDAVTPMVGEPLTSAGVLELLGYEPGERLSVLLIHPGHSDPERLTGLHRVADVPGLVAWAQAEGVNAWHSLSTFTADATGRGKAAEVARVPALWADLDVVAADPRLKPVGIPTWALAWQIIEDLSILVGTRPVYVVYSGHGLQPVWAVDREESLDAATMRAVLRRWGWLVKHVARLRSCAVDSVFDAPRVLRATGSTNLKDPAAPVPVRAYATGGSPLGVAELLEVFEAYNVPSNLEEDEDSQPVPVASWRWADQTCSYVAGMLKAWASHPRPNDRHPWLVGAVVRLAAAHRQGCLSEAAWHGGLVELEDRMRVWCAVDPSATGLDRQAQEERLARVGDELDNAQHGAIAWALTRVESMSEEKLAREYERCRTCRQRRELRGWVPPAEGGEAL